MGPSQKSKFKRCILHIGSGKTGTSSLQSSLYKARKYLRSLGYFYASNDANHIFLASYFRSDPHDMAYHSKHGRITDDAIERYHKAEMDRLHRDLEGFEGHTLVFSSEYFPPASLDDCIKLREYLLTLCETVTVVCYIRHPVSHAISRSQQSLKMGFSTLDTLKHSYFSPKGILPKFISVFGKDNITVRPFDRETLFGSSVVPDFAHIIGLSDQDYAGIEEIRGNESLSLEGALLSDALNRQFPREKDGKWNPERAQAVNMMNIPGDKFSLPEDVLSRIEEEAREELEFLKDEFNLDLKRPEIETSPGNAAWGQATQDELARRLNMLTLQVQHLEAEVALKDGILLAKSGKRLKAIVLFRKSLRLKTDNWGALSRLVHHLWVGKDKEEAAAEIRHYRSLNPDEDRTIGLRQKYNLSD